MSMDEPSQIDHALEDLIQSYSELNPPSIDIFDEEPSPLSFMRYVARNRPFIVRKGAANWIARERWSADYLCESMRGQRVNVAITPRGNADSVTHSGTLGKEVFVKPFEREERFEEVLRHIQEQEKSPTDYFPTRYAQTQNDNLRNEYSTIFSDVPATIPFARIALEREPDAVNFWLGNSRSETALHKDNYENIYVQILGKKHFVILPPWEFACVNEKSFVAATYQSRQSSKAPEIVGEDLEIVVDQPEKHVSFPSWDPDNSTTNATSFSKLSKPLRFTLNEGDMLYLPALWYHKVSQTCSDEGICCAVNYWYDLDFSGPLWSASSFVRSVSLLALHSR